MYLRGFLMKGNKIYLILFLGFIVMCLISSLLIDIHISFVFWFYCLIDNRAVNSIFLNFWSGPGIVNTSWGGFLDVTFLGLQNMHILFT